jgi:RNA polymerase sigma-70 factor (ECF subfamily)
MPEWDDDDRLAARYTAEGDTAAMETLYRRHVAATYGFARRFLPTVEDAEEATSESWFRVFRALRDGQFRGQAAFKTWVFGICRNVCSERIRQPRLPMLSLSDLQESHRESWSLFEPQPSPPSGISEALTSLSDDHRLILTLCDLEGFTAIEAAKIMGRTPAAAKSLHIRARRALRDRLQEYRQEADA